MKRVTIGELIVTLREIPTVQLTAAQRPHPEGALSFCSPGRAAHDFDKSAD
jgi:hypothetical protein